jgi:hypothetical protein
MRKMLVMDDLGTARQKTGSSAPINGAAAHAQTTGTVARTFRRNKAFIEDVLRENELLRYEALHLKQKLTLARDEHIARAGDVMNENFLLHRQLKEITAQFDALSRQREDFRERFQEVECQNENLLNLYVSSYQLHSTLKQETALGVVSEILLNLLGAEVFTLWIVGEGTGRMELVKVTDECGLFGEARPRIPAASLAALRGAQTWFAPNGQESDALCCIPLKLDEKTVGAIVIHKLLLQKSGFSSLDEELLGLLAGQAAATLIGARLHACFGMNLAWDPADEGYGTSSG